MIVMKALIAWIVAAVIATPFGIHPLWLLPIVVIVFQCCTQTEEVE